jgi:hypothetical protein
MLTMERASTGDLILGGVMIGVGVVPLGAVALWGAQPVGSAFTPAGVPAALAPLIVPILVLCGVVLASAGVLTIKYGRVESETAELY